MGDPITPPRPEPDPAQPDEPLPMPDDDPLPTPQKPPSKEPLPDSPKIGGNNDFPDPREV
ncbi:hypothetical protein LJR231_005296 [Phyllobacterium sp. LjRoot231]|uniref:hypothetical protein n=1 Tax=Phyllobacterium sp. LjRoot231 TaxID=3342289 RepID=UPI003ED0C9E3